jgi:hypothetical protein
MGWVIMRERELNRIEVLAQVNDGRLSVQNTQMQTVKRDYALALVKENYQDFDPTLAAEMLAEQHGFKLSRETPRKWMQEDCIWLSRKECRKFHQPRLRQECYGELIQIDGSDHHGLKIVALPAPCSCSSMMQPSL